MDNDPVQNTMGTRLHGPPGAMVFVLPGLCFYTDGCLRGMIVSQKEETKSLPSLSGRTLLGQEVTSTTCYSS